MTDHISEPVEVEQERKGDAWQMTVRAYQDDAGRGPYMLVSRHDDGGVTLRWFDRFQGETDRISVRREVWDQVAAFASDQPPSPPAKGER